MHSLLINDAKCLCVGNHRPPSSNHILLSCSPLGARGNIEGFHMTKGLV